MTSLPEEQALPLSAPAASSIGQAANSPNNDNSELANGEPLLNPIRARGPPATPSPRKSQAVVHPRLHVDRVESSPELKARSGPAAPAPAPAPASVKPTSPRVVRSGSPRAPATPPAKPGIQRTLSLKAIGESVKALVGAETPPPQSDVPTVPERESEKPFPFVKLHVVTETQEAPPFPGVKLHVVEKTSEVKPVFPGIPLHLPVGTIVEEEAEDERSELPPPPAFPGLRLHVVDETGLKRTYVAGQMSPRKGDKVASPRSGTLPLDLEMRAKSRNALPSPGSDRARGSPRAVIAVPSSGQHAMQGHRDNMEDAHVWLDWLHDDVPSLSWESRWAFYAVYDGHGGPECAHAVRPLVHRHVLAAPEFSAGDIGEAMKVGFAETDKELIQKAHKEGWKSGATVVAALLSHDTVYTANLGDSELVLGRRKKAGGSAMDAVLLTHKHKPSNPEERKRIEALGGTIVFGRLFGDLAVSRAFGDKDYKKPVWEVDYVSVEPYFSQTKLDPSLDEFLIMACDGLWDKLTYQEAVDLVREWRAAGKTPDECAQMLNDTSFQRNSRDNISTVVIFLTWVTEERDMALRQQLRDHPRQAPDLTQIAPYVPSSKESSPVMLHAPLPAAAGAPDSPAGLMPSSPSSELGGDKAKRKMVRQGRTGLAGYTVSPSNSPSVPSPLASSAGKLEQGSSSSSTSNKADSPVATAVMRESVTWEHSVSQTILSFAEEKKAAAAAQPPPQQQLQQQP